MFFANTMDIYHFYHELSEHPYWDKTPNYSPSDTYIYLQENYNKRSLHEDDLNGA